MAKIFVDLETTGVDRKTARIVEIAAILVDDAGKETEYRTLVNPGIKIPDATSKVHNIYDKDVEDAPLFEDIASEIFSLMAKADTFIAYNFTFDFQILKNEFKRAANLDLNEAAFTYFDPMKIFKSYFPHKLHVAYEHYTGKVMENAHSALHDIRATKEVFEVQQLRHSDLFEMDPKNEVIGGWFVKNSDGKIVLSKGKYKDVEAESIDDYGYYKWMSKLEDLTESEKGFIKKCMVKK